jgi:hypothetical protein
MGLPVPATASGVNDKASLWECGRCEQRSPGVQVELVLTPSEMPVLNKMHSTPGCFQILYAANVCDVLVAVYAAVKNRLADRIETAHRPNHLFFLLVVAKKLEFVLAFAYFVDCLGPISHVRSSYPTPISDVISSYLTPAQKVLEHNANGNARHQILSEARLLLSYINAPRNPESPDVSISSLDDTSLGMAQDHQLMQHHFALQVQAGKLQKITSEPEEGGDRLITPVGALNANNYVHYSLAIKLQSMLNSSEKGGGLPLADWWVKEVRYCPLLVLLTKQELQEHHPQNMTIIGDSISKANVNQLPHCDDSWKLSADGGISSPHGKSHIMALPVAEGEIATLGFVAQDHDGNLIAVEVQFRAGQIVCFNALHFGSGGNGDSSSPRVHCYTGKAAVPSEYDISTGDVLLPPLQLAHRVNLRAFRT